MSEDHYYWTDDTLSTRDFLNNIVSSLTNTNFKNIEDITLNNLRHFLIELLDYEEKRHFKLSTLLNILDELEIYLHRRYMSDFPETFYPNLPDSDSRSIGIDAIDYIRESILYAELVNEARMKLIEYLKTSPGKEEQAHQDMKSYIRFLQEKKREECGNTIDGSIVILGPKF